MSRWTVEKFQQLLWQVCGSSRNQPPCQNGLFQLRHFLSPLPEGDSLIPVLGVFSRSFMESSGSKLFAEGVLFIIQGINGRAEAQHPQHCHLLIPYPSHLSVSYQLPSFQACMLLAIRIKPQGIWFSCSRVKPKPTQM